MLGLNTKSSALAASIALAGVLVAGAPAAVNAQQATGGERGVLEEIEVTARKREESIQDIPISVSAFTAAELDQLGVTNLSRLSDFANGFTFETFGGRRGAEGDVSRPVIRGQSNILGESNAAIFVDGILYTESIYSFPFDVVERVEIIRGPQSAQFGRATFSGAINLITKRGTNEYRNRVNVRAAQDDDYEVNMSSGGPLIEDKLFYYVQGRYYTYGGEWKNELDGSTVGGELSYGFNTRIEYLPSDNLRLDFKFGFNQDKDDIPAQKVQDRFSNNCFLDQARQYYCGEMPEFESVTLEIERLLGEDGLDREVLMGTATVEWDIGGSGNILTFNGGYNDAESTFGNDQTFLGDGIQFAGGIFVRVEDSDREEWSTELRFESPVSEQFRYTLGAFMYERDRYRIRRFPGTQTLITNFGTEQIENQAIFGAVEWDVSDRLTAGLELRYQEDTISLLPGGGASKLEETFDSTQPRFTLSYAQNEDWLWYLNVAQGNKPGLINTDPRIDEAFRFVDEEEALNYEVGFKSTLRGGNMTLNAAVFYIDWTKQQLTQSGLFNNIPISFTTNAGETTVYGVEIESDFVIADNWTGGFSYALADATFDENCDPVQGAELTGFDCVSSVTGQPGGSVEGNVTPNAPEHMATLNSTYVVPMANDMDLFFRGDYSYKSKLYAQVHNLAYTADRHFLNLKAGLQTDNWTLTVFVDNVLEDLTQSTVVRFADLVNLNVGPNDDPAQDNVPGTTPVERGFLVPLPRSRRFGVNFTYEF